MIDFIRHRIETARTNEDGSSLIIALAVLSVSAIIVAGVLTQAQTNLLHTSVTRGKEDRNYAAEAGLDSATQYLRTHNTVCRNNGDTGTVGTYTFNNQSVTVTCRVIGGSLDTGALTRYALVTTKPGGLLHTMNGSNDLNIKGPVYINGDVDLKKNISVTDGFITQHKTPCNSSVTLDPRLSATGGTSCTANGPIVPSLTFPSIPVTAQDPNGITPAVPNCRVFKPGRYNSPPNLISGTNYFASGDYYFTSGDFNVGNGNVVVGGTPKAGESRLLVPADACQNDSLAAGTASGNGAAFIFGGTATFGVANNSTVEMFSRAWGDYQVSMVAVPNGTPGYTANNVLPASFLNEGTGTANFTTHGMIFAPDATVTLFASNNTVATAYGGVYVGEIWLQASNPGIGLALQAAQPDPTNVYRTIVLTATATLTTGAAQSNGTQKAEAVVEIANDTNLSGMTAVVESWRTVGVS